MLSGHGQRTKRPGNPPNESPRCTARSSCFGGPQGTCRLGDRSLGRAAAAQRLARRGPASDRPSPLDFSAKQLPGIRPRGVPADERTSGCVLLRADRGRARCRSRKYFTTPRLRAGGHRLQVRRRRGRDASRRKVSDALDSEEPGSGGDLPGESVITHTSGPIPRSAPPCANSCAKRGGAGCIRGNAHRPAARALKGSAGKIHDRTGPRSLRPPASRSNT